MALPFELLPLGPTGRSTNLPLQLTTFVGREREHERVFVLSRGRLSESAFAAAWSAGGGMTVDEAIVSALLAPTHPTSSIATRTWPELTARESEVAVLISRGLTNREIAAALVIAERTAEAHVTHVLTKLGLRSRTQIAVWATQHGTLAASAAGNEALGSSATAYIRAGAREENHGRPAE